MTMRVLLVAPSRSDPAHRRVLTELTRRYERAGDAVACFPDSDGLAPAELRRRLERLLRDWRADICHIQYFSRGLGYLGRVRFPDGMRLVLTHQGASFEIMEHADVFRGLARRADFVTCVSRQGLGEMRALLPGLRSKSCWIPNGTDFSAAPKRAAPNVPRRPFILCVGRLAAYKGIDLLLMAYAGLRPKGHEPDLVVCGPDQTEGRLPRFARELGLAGRVRFMGDTGPSRLRRLLADCLFFVLPSRRENLPMALLEAMAAGKAVVAAAVGGVAEVVTDGIDGLLIPPQDVAALASALDRLTRDARLRNRLGRRARSRARSFDWSVIAAGYRRAYARTAARRAPRDHA